MGWGSTGTALCPPSLAPHCAVLVGTPQPGVGRESIVPLFEGVGGVPACAKRFRIVRRFFGATPRIGGTDTTCGYPSRFPARGQPPIRCREQSAGIVFSPRYLCLASRYIRFSPRFLGLVNCYLFFAPRLRIVRAVPIRLGSARTLPRTTPVSRSTRCRAPRTDSATPPRPIPPILSFGA